MKSEEVLKQFKEWNESGWSKSETPSSEALILAIQALEKQIPKKPIIDAHRILCPECNLLVAHNKSIEQHCWTCGQNLEGCVIK